MPSLPMMTLLSIGGRFSVEEGVEDGAVSETSGAMVVAVVGWTWVMQAPLKQL